VYWNAVDTPSPVFPIDCRNLAEPKACPVNGDSSV
jgi:hypothetical protein